MTGPVKAGVPILGVIFLVLAMVNFVRGDNWVVWAILGFLFGGFGVLARKREGGA